MKFFKLILINSLIFSFFIFIAELILGEWKSALNFEAFGIPGLVTSEAIKYDSKHLYNSKDEGLITYTRDSEGYRSKSSNKNKNIVLTIGGSTTDQRYITDGETWQDNLDTKFPHLDFINAGIDGQSTYGHIISINSWHKKTLDPESIHAIIFYLGMNDRRLLSNSINKFDTPKSTVMKLKIYLNKYSFFYSKIKKLLRDPIKVNSGITLAMHGGKSQSNLALIKGKKFTGKYINEFKPYKQLFKRLLDTTKNAFPNTKIIIVQQQAPGCKFTSKTTGTDIYPYINKLESNNLICKNLANVYATQNEVIKSHISNYNLEIMPMYLENILGENDCYDYIHTTPDGSRKISDYISKSLFLNQ